LLAVLDVEPGRVLLDRAPPAVLAALPAFGAEAVQAVMALRERGEAVSDPLGVLGLLSPPARQAFTAHYAELVAATAAEPDAWVLAASDTAGSPTITAVIELRLARAGSRAAIVRRWEWLE
jgi:hypothetical protein